MNEASVLYVVLLIIEIKSKINPYGPTVINDYANCIISMVENGFNESGLLIFANTNNVSVSVTRIRSELLKYVHRDVKYSVEIASPTDAADICDDNEKLGVLHMDQFEAVPAADYFIIIIDNYNDFVRIGSKIIRSRNWNPQAKFIVLFFRFAKSIENIHYIERMLTCIFSLNVVNIVVIVPQENNIRNGIVYGWRPYDPPKYCGYFDETAKNRLVEENLCVNGKLLKKKPIFENKLPMDMKGCVLRILAINKPPLISSVEEDPNIEKVLVGDVFKRYNIVAEYEIIINSFRGERYYGEWDGGLKLLTAKKGDILLGGIFPDFDVHEDFHTSTSYLFDVYTWVVPRAYSSPPYIALFICFQRNVWYSVCITFVICGFIWVILGQLCHGSRYDRNIGHCFVNTWICVFGFCTYNRPRKENLRVFYVFLNLYCILILTAYQTKLIDVLRNPTFEYQIKTIEELVESGLKFGGSEDLHDLFKNSSDPLDYFIGEQWTDVNDTKEAMIDVVIHRNFSLLCSRFELDHVTAIMPELSDAFGNYKYYAFELNMFSVPLEMVALRGFPFMHLFSETLSDLKQTGVTAAVRRYFTTVNTMRRQKLLRSIEGKQANIDALTMQHLQGGFLALILGYMIGTVILVSEIIWNLRIIQNKVTIWKKNSKKTNVRVS